MGSLKVWFKGGSRKANIWGELPKKGRGGPWTACKFKVGGGVFEGGGVVDTPMHTMNLAITLTLILMPTSSLLISNKKSTILQLIGY